MRYHRARWIARVATTITVLYLARTIQRLVGAWLSDDPLDHAIGAWWMWGRSLFASLLIALTVGLWRVSLSRRPPPVSVTDSDAAWTGRPEPEPGDGRHLGLSGEIPPPSRW